MYYSTAKFVKEQHFGGGGFLSRKVENEEGKEENKFKSKKERIEEIIAESKLEKANKKKDKEEVDDAVRKLDSELNTFLSLMQGNFITDNDKEKVKKFVFLLTLLLLSASF